MTVHSGLCVSKGDVRGVVCVVKDVSKTAVEYIQNTILVMKSLDRGLIVRINKNVVGIIAEQGNIGSHGAGILRQRNIPCVLRIKDATSIFKDGDVIELKGSENCVISNLTNLAEVTTKIEDPDVGKFTYSSIGKEYFSINDIRSENKWVCPRPDRAYQKLRYDIIRSVYASSGTYMFGLPPAQVKQNEFGAVCTYGVPYVSDICRFVLCNPTWLVEKAKLRSVEFNEIKIKLKSMMEQTDTKHVNGIYSIFSSSVKLYQSMFKYVSISQAISDELLDIYLDFLRISTGAQVSKDILQLKSDYVERCLTSGIDPGVSQRWNPDSHTPHVWDGELDYTPLERDELIVSSILNMQNDADRMLLDYNSFRIIVPLVYQLAEEYFYISSSVNSFINWGIIKLCEYFNKVNNTNISVEEYYEMTLYAVTQHFYKMEESI